MVYILCYVPKRQNEKESASKMNEDSKAVGHVQVTLVDDTIKLQETANTSRSKVRNKDASHC